MKAEDVVFLILSIAYKYNLNIKGLVLRSGDYKKLKEELGEMCKYHDPTQKKLGVFTVGGPKCSVEIIKE